MWHNVISLQVVFGACLFGTVSMLSYLVISGATRKERDPVRERLRGGRGSTPLAGQSARATTLSPMVQRMSKKLAEPLMPKDREEASRLRRKFAHAGIYSTSAMHLFVVCKIVLCLLGIASGATVGLTMREPLIGAAAAAGLGLIGLAVPSMWLRWTIRRRHWALQTALPDALDLMVVCVEAGLTVDAALQRVGQEIALAHPDISRELGITHMETRVGVSRIDALRNLGLRTGFAPLQSLAAMLVQSERFGTSIGAALRVHAESLRVKRQHAAEERAAKTTVKLAFPVVLFIFPTVLIVLGAPAFILFFQSPLFENR